MNNLLPTVLRRYPLALLLLLASLTIVLITEDSNRRAAVLVHRLGAIAENRLHLYDMVKGVLDAESAQRGYLLTGREEYLAPYDLGLRDIDYAFRQLDAAYSHEPGSAALLQKLHVLAETKLSELAVTVRMQKEGKRQAGKDLTLSGVGQDYMNAIRTTGNALMTLETTRLHASETEVSDILLFSRVGVALLSGVSLLLVLVNTRQDLVFKDQQEAHRKAMYAEQQRLQAEVTRRTTQLLKLNNHLQTAREDERHRIARDLHDELGALLTAAKLDAARTKSRLGAAAPEALEQLNHLVETLNAGIALKRRIIEDLWPSALRNLGLVATLDILAREFSRSSGLPVHCTLEPVQLGASAELVVYRLAQEATTNIAKYAQARNVWLSLTNQDDQVVISVRDDGVGFDVARFAEKAHGLLGMRFRVEAEHGMLEITSTPGQGAEIRARLPRSTNPRVNT